MLFDKHIELVEMVNNAKNEREHMLAEMTLIGFRVALRELDINHLCECDMHYIEQGIDRPMCCGVFLDWKSSEENNNA